MLQVIIQRRETCSLVEDEHTNRVYPVTMPTWTVIIEGYESRGEAEDFVKRVLMDAKQKPPE